LPLVFGYRVVRFSNGDVETWCSIWTSQFQFSASAYWSASPQGSTPDVCFLVYDLDTPSTGYWRFTAVPGESATYVDPSSTTWNGTVVSFPPEGCTSS
jgi:hypothetical protein